MQVDDKGEDMSSKTELHRIDNMGIGTYEGGFTVWEEEVSKGEKTAGRVLVINQTYHAYLHDALKNASLRVAKAKADTLFGFMSVFKATAKELANATAGV